jgi:hypothetical protein
MQIETSKNTRTHMNANRLVGIFLFLSILASCARAGKYDELNKITDDYFAAYERHGERLETIQDSKALAAAINDLAAATEQFNAKFLDLGKRHLEVLQDTNSSEAKALIAKNAARADKFRAIMTATQNAYESHNSSPAVVAAFERLRKANAVLGH